MKMSEIVKGLIVVFADPDPETEITLADALDLYAWVLEQEKAPRPAMVPVYDMDRLPTHLTTAPMPPVQDGPTCTVTAGSEAGGEPADTHTHTHK